MKAYGEPWQYSVFYCTLKDIDRVRLENELREILNLKEDQVLIVDLGSNEDAARSSAAVLGSPPPQQDDENGGNLTSRRVTSARRNSSPGISIGMTGLGEVLSRSQVH